MTKARVFRESVGEVAQQAAGLEGVVAITAWGLAGLDSVIARVVVPNNMDRMLSLILDLLPLRVDDEALRQEVKEWVGEVRSAYRDRSAVLHSLWIGPGGEEVHWRADLRPLGRPVDERTHHDLLALAKRMELLANARAIFLGRLAAQVPGPWSVASA